MIRTVINYGYVTFWSIATLAVLVVWGMYAWGQIRYPYGLGVSRETSRRVNCAGNLKQIGLACIIYAHEHDGQFPASFSDLHHEYLGDGKVYSCPSALEPKEFAADSNYRYVAAGLAETASRAAPLAYCVGHHYRHITVLFSDGSVSGESHATWSRFAAKNDMILPFDLPAESGLKKRSVMRTALAMFLGPALFGGFFLLIIASTMPSEFRFAIKKRRSART
jgi:hypothetical protein